MEIPRSFIVPCELDGERIDRCITRLLSPVSRSAVQHALAGGAVLLNGAAPKKNTTVKIGDRIDIASLEAHSNQHALPLAQAIELSILYEDAYCVAVNKQPGLSVHPGNGRPDTTLVNALLYRYPSMADSGGLHRPGIVHRLDMDTSGVLLTARTNEAHAAFTKMFAARTMSKTYYGICMGAQPADSGAIDAPVGRSRRDRTVQCVRPDGRNAVTEYVCEKFVSGLSVVRLHPLTGRTHQLRLHCRHAGFPIIADSTYGNDRQDVLKLEPLVRPFAHKVLKCFSRQALHARTLAFVHPFTGKQVEITAPFPDDFKQAFEVFGLEKQD